MLLDGNGHERLRDFFYQLLHTRKELHNLRHHVLFVTFSTIWDTVSSKEAKGTHFFLKVALSISTYRVQTLAELYYYLIRFQIIFLLWKFYGIKKSFTTMSWGWYIILWKSIDITAVLSISSFGSSRIFSQKVSNFYDT